MMQSNKNQIIVAAAGSRKTTLIVEEALRNSIDKRVLVITYTVENLTQIETYLIEHNGLIPVNIVIQSWYSFLLTHGARPYQNFLYDKARIPAIFFQEGRSSLFTKKRNIERYYFSPDGRIYTDKIAEFACECNSRSNGLVINRLECIYDYIYIDEIQDLAGYDFEFIELLMLSKIWITVVGDCRQATYFTNCSPKNTQFKGKSIIHLFREWEKMGICEVIEKTESYRCNQAICDFADKLYPDLPRTRSLNTRITGHDGVFIINDNQLCEYIKKYNPKILRDTKRTNTFNLPAINFGIAKGQNFDRVLIFPNGPIRTYLSDGDPNRLSDMTKARFYVAITRARYSVTFIQNEGTSLIEISSFNP